MREMPDELAFDFMVAHEDGEPLRVWLTRYPEHASEMVDLAITMDLPDPPLLPPEEEEALVRRGMEILHKMLVEQYPATSRG
jgi:hypothetical protein